MKCKLEIDLHDPTLTPPIRSIIENWAEVDWFTPSGSTDEEGSRLFREHHDCARRNAADHLAVNLDVQSAIGGWAEFVTWCTRVRRPSAWDWKYSVLKPMSTAHSKTFGWKANALPQESPLILRFGDAGNEQVIWRGLSPDIGALPANPAGECATFYLGYAHSDLVACIEWQLAENHDNLSSNPYFSLIRCYGAGFYPFCLDAATVVMFASRLTRMRYRAPDSCLTRSQRLHAVRPASGRFRDSLEGHRTILRDPQHFVDHRAVFADRRGDVADELDLFTTQKARTFDQNDASMDVSRRASLSKSSTFDVTSTRSSWYARSSSS